MRFFDINKKEPKENRSVMIVCEDYGWGSGCTLKTDFAQLINGQYILFPYSFGRKIDKSSILKWSYV